MIDPPKIVLLAAHQCINPVHVLLFKVRGIGTEMKACRIGHLDTTSSISGDMSEGIFI